MKVLLFDDFVEDKVLGDESFTISEEAFAKWTSLYPDDTACRPLMPPGMIAMVVMRGYMKVIPKRPPGNMHAEQRIDLIRLPNIGDTVTTTYRCARKEERLGRKWVYLTSDTADDSGESLFLGRMTSIWAK